jgi:hypothetical protein
MAMRVDIPPPPVVTRGGGGGSGWVNLLKARNDIDAHLLAGRLAEAGVETRTVKDNGAPGAWLFGGWDPWAPVLVMVRRMQLSDAQVVLAEISWEGPAVAPEKSAASSRSWRGPALWWAAALALGIFFTALGLTQADRYLDTCTRSGCDSVPSVVP